MAEAPVINVYCTICSEYYYTEDRIVSTSCGHVFHENCLNKWRMSIFACPECSRESPGFIRIFLNAMDELELDDDPIDAENMAKEMSLLENKLDNSEKHFLEATLALTDAEQRLEDLKSQVELHTACITSFNQKIQDLELSLQESEKNLFSALNELSKMENNSQQKKGETVEVENPPSPSSASLLPDCVVADEMNEVENPPSPSSASLLPDCVVADEMNEVENPPSPLSASLLPDCVVADEMNKVENPPSPSSASLLPDCVVADEMNEVDSPPSPSSASLLPDCVVADEINNEK